MVLVLAASCLSFANSGAFSEDDTFWLAHKGYSGKAPANTLPAMREAVLAGFDGAEMDVWVCKDCILLSHDKNLKSATGKSKRITSLSGSSRHAYQIVHGKGIAKYGKQTIPTLDEALRTIWATADAVGDPDFTVELDIKQSGISDAAVKSMISLVGNRNVRINTSSFRVIRKFKRYRTGDNIQLWMYVGNRSKSAAKRFIKKASRAGVCGVSMPPGNWSSDNIRYAKSLGLKLAAYTNKRKAIKRLLGYGFDRICCNYKFFKSN